MSAHYKPAAGALFPAVSLPRAGGGAITPASGSGWRLVVVYRGKHCPLCKPYLSGLDDLLDQFTAANVAVYAISADPEEKALADLAQYNWRFPIGFGLTVEQMKILGLYVSAPRSVEETDRPFAEPALFLLNPEGRVQIVDISNAPFARPDLSAVLRGTKMIQERNYPIRGTMA